MLRRTTPLAALALLLAVAAGSASAAPGATGAGTLESYIVTLDDAVPFPAAVGNTHAARLNGQLGHVYQHALNGYSISVTAGAAAALAQMPGVVSVEADGIATVSTTQSNATWGLDRIDQRNLPLSGTYTYNNTGTGVNAYIIDTGIRYSHNEFDGLAQDRAVFGYDSFGGNGSDCHGHGTHVAGTVGGSVYGVAKAVKLYAVRVLDCNGSGSWSGVIAGVDWVTANHVKPAVANMSLGGSGNTSVDNAVKNSIAKGVSYAVAAGNGNFVGIHQDACKYSPARVPEAMTIGATDQSDKKASWSNYGNCVDWFAPGVGITSAWRTSDTATNTISGTSMATPHTAGVAALYLQGNSGASPATVRNALYDKTTKNKVSSSRTANNHLLFTDY